MLSVKGAVWLGVIVVAFSSLLHLLKTPYPVPAPETSAVFITGTSSGIGRDAAIELACKGYLVFAGVRKEADAASIADESAARKCSPNLVPVIVDVSSHDQLLAARDVVADVLERTQASRAPRTLAVVVANAGIATLGSVLRSPCSCRISSNQSVMFVWTSPFASQEVLKRCPWRP